MYFVRSQPSAGRFGTPPRRIVPFHVHRLEEYELISQLCAREQLLRSPLATSSLRGLSSRAASSRASLHSALLQRGLFANERPPQARRAPSRPPLHAARWSSALAACCCSAPAHAPQHSAVEEHRHCSYVYHARISLAQAGFTLTTLTYASTARLPCAISRPSSST